MNPNRREALALFAASFAAACGRPAPSDALPYVEHPPGLVPGEPRRYATAHVADGLAEGLLVTSHEGRPTKIEGNPEHPASLGATRARAQASVLGLYDPDRARILRRGNVPQPPGALAAWLGGALPGLHVLLEPSTSPTVGRLLDAVRERRPAAGLHAWAPRNAGAAVEGLRIAFGAPLVARPNLAAARVIVSIGADFLDDGPWAVRNARDWAARRTPPDMSRVYVSECAPTLTGLAADVRVALTPAEIPAFAAALAEAFLGAGPWSAWRLSPAGARVAEQAVADLRGAPGVGAVAVGWEQPAWVHALIGAVNAAIGAPVDLSYTPWVTPDPGLDRLSAALDAGEVGTLLMLGGNPAFSARHLSALLPKAGCVLRLGPHDDETSARAEWRVPQLHPLESWGDARAYDGTVTFLQPLIAPLVEGWTLEEVLARLAGVDGAARALVRATWSRALATEDAWSEAIRYGLLPGTAAPRVDARVDLDAIRRAVPPPPAPAQLVLATRTCPRVGDGRDANNPWLQELPDPISQVAWANPAWVGPATARSLGLAEPAGMLEVGGVRLPAMAIPGHPEGVVTVTRGYGRRVGSVASGVGVDVELLAVATGGAVEARAIGGGVSLPVAQRAWSREGKDVARGGTLAEWRAEPARVVGEPPAEGPLYVDVAAGGSPHLTAPRQWAMTVDLGACTGCGACAVACQAENNVPTVGPIDVWKGRRMHWLRIDRYERDGGYTFQPMLCQHCEDAPCEYVCPTNATVHSPDGINEQVYNRCVGTRFCSNNCPWKVRRFNWFDYDARRDPLVALQLNPQVTARARGVMEKCTLCVQRIRAWERAGRLGQPWDGPLQTACQQACPTRAITFGDQNDADAPVAALREDPRSYAELGELGTRPRVRYLARLHNPKEA